MPQPPDRHNPSSLALSRSSYFLARDLHPLSWWLWALCMAIAASRTTNPWLLALIIAVVCHVVISRRSDAPWANAFRLYLYVAAAIVGIRIVFRILFGGEIGNTVVIQLPGIDLPQWAVGVQLLGDVTAEGLLIAFYDGLRLATMIICLGAANALANPKRLLKSMPPALYEIGTAVTVALSVFGQLAESVSRVRRARQLRGEHGRRFRALQSIIVPVLADALDRSLQLAASMDARGYGRSAQSRSSAISGTLMIAGLTGVCIGVYVSLDAVTTTPVAGGILAASCAVALWGFTWAGRQVERTRYRPDRWHMAEIVVGCCGIAVAAGMISAASLDMAGLHPDVVPLSWPQLSWVPLVVVLLGVLPSLLTPPPTSTADVHDELPHDSHVAASSAGEMEVPT